MPMKQYAHTVEPTDTAAALGSGDLEVLATPRLVTWFEAAAFDRCSRTIDEDRTTVGTVVRIEHTRPTRVGGSVTVHCGEPINDGRRLVCNVRATDSTGEEIAAGEVHRAVVDPDRFMSKCPTNDCPPQSATA